METEGKTISKDRVWMAEAKYLTIDDIQDWLINLEDRVSKIEQNEQNQNGTK